MFRRLIIEDWQRTLSLVGWMLFALVFVTSGLRAFLLPRTEVKKLEDLPLEKEFHE